MNDRIIIPLDVNGLDPALDLVERLGPDTTFYKVGLELFTACGPAVVEALRVRQKDVFLDLKLHDIPNTVAGAVRRAAELDVRFLTVHGTGGGRMIEAAVEAAESRVTILAVTVLTSLDETEVARIWGRPLSDVGPEVVRIAGMALDAGAGGIVCSPWEAESVAALKGPGVEVVTPGIRFAEGSADDQRRVATPSQAIGFGATRLVMGRPITRAPDPIAAFRRALDEVDGALVGAS